MRPVDGGRRGAGRIPRRFLFPAIGVLLGLGSPAGAILLSLARRSDESPWGLWILADLEAYRFFYVYMTIGTVTAFVVAGLVAGLAADQLARSSDHFQELALADPLTGIFNRRYLEARLAEEVSRARRLRTPLACLMIDLDHFKRLNDRFGHATGDAVLIRLAGLLHDLGRAYEFAARYGGEEFVVVLPGAGAREARRAAERLCRAAAALEFRSGTEPLRTTISVGAAELTAGMPGAAALLATADAALYRAKAAGRNRVVMASRSGARAGRRPGLTTVGGPT